ncbi:MAG: branched-chain amino acid aminotransferase [Methylobacteriaceae bacterium]|nr:branched-chain amino acid aminotransferase [Methylobacteriaceae bacterium]
MTPPASETWTFFEGDWHRGNTPIMGVRTHGAWLCSSVFDGARAFEGVTPDLDLHLKRVNQSAANFGLKAAVSLDTWRELVGDGCKRFAQDAELYIRPMYWAESGFGGGVLFDADSTNWCLSLYEAPMPEPVGTSVTLSPFRRPSADCAPVEAKAGCLYPNGTRALIEAKARGFGNCLMRDMDGNIAEFANANAFLARDGIVYTPAPNGSFLDGVTRRRVINLMREAGIEVIEKALTYGDFETADEIFSTGNYAKVTPIIGIDDRPLQPGPMFRRARALYWEYAHSTARL